MSNIERDHETLIIFVDKDGREVRRGTPNAIELRSAGAGWRWTDFDGSEWGTAGAPIQGESMPRWVKRRELIDPDTLSPQ